MLLKRKNLWRIYAKTKRGNLSVVAPLSVNGWARPFRQFVLASPAGDRDFLTLALVDLGSGGIVLGGPSAVRNRRILRTASVGVTADPVVGRSADLLGDIVGALERASEVAADRRDDRLLVVEGTETSERDLDERASTGLHGVERSSTLGLVLGRGLADDVRRLGVENDRRLNNLGLVGLGHVEAREVRASGALDEAIAAVVAVVDIALDGERAGNAEDAALGRSISAAEAAVTSRRASNRGGDRSTDGIATDIPSWDIVELVLKFGVGFVSSEVIAPMDENILPISKKSITKIKSIKM